VYVAEETPDAFRYDGFSHGVMMHRLKTSRISPLDFQYRKASSTLPAASGRRRFPDMTTALPSKSHSMLATCIDIWPGVVYASCAATPVADCAA